MPRRDFFFFLTLTVASFFLLLNLTTAGIYNSHDGQIHLARFAQFSQALGDGQFPPRWLGNWNFGFGYPVFVYVYSTPYFLASFLHFLGLNFEVTFKILIFLSIAFSGIAFYLFAKNHFTRFAAFAGSIIYISAPYRFADIYERGALGESLMFAVIPILFLSLKVISKNLFWGFLLISLAIFFSLTIHTLTFLIFIIPLLLYSIVIFKRQMLLYLLSFFAIIFGLALAAFQWIPAVFEQKFIDLGKTYFDIYQGTFLSVNQLLRIPHPSINIGTGIQLGLAQSGLHIVSIIFLVYMVFTKKRIDKMFLLFFTLTPIAAFLTTDLSKFIWDGFAPLSTILFPWRFLTLTTFCVAFLSAYLAARFKKYQNGIIIFTVALLALFPSRHYLFGQGWYTAPRTYYENYQDLQKLDNYYLPVGVRKLEGIALPQASIVEGAGQLAVIKRQSNKLHLQADLFRASQIQFHTIYFPGWQLTVDGKKWPLINTYRNLEGIIVASLPAGRHKVKLEFLETPLRRYANILTTVSFGLFLALISFRLKYVK